MRKEQINESKPKEFKRYVELEEYNYRIIYFYKEPINPEKDCVDFEVECKGKLYKGTFITPKCIDERLKNYEKTGENGDGSYFWAKGMIIIKEITNETIEKTLIDLIKRNDFTT